MHRSRTESDHLVDARLFNSPCDKLHSRRAQDTCLQRIKSGRVIARRKQARNLVSVVKRSRGPLKVRNSAPKKSLGNFSERTVCVAVLVQRRLEDLEYRNRRAGLFGDQWELVQYGSGARIPGCAACRRLSQDKRFGVFGPGLHLATCRLDLRVGGRCARLDCGGFGHHLFGCRSCSIRPNALQLAKARRHFSTRHKTFTSGSPQTILSIRVFPPRLAMRRASIFFSTIQSQRRCPPSYRKSFHRVCVWRHHGSLCTRDTIEHHSYH